MINETTMRKELGFVTGTYLSGDTARLYGHVIERAGETIGIITGSTKHGWDAYRLDGGKILSFRSYRTRKAAFNLFTEAQ